MSVEIQQPVIRTHKRKVLFNNTLPKDPAIQSYNDWLPANRSMYGHFRIWLKDSSYSASAINQYSVAARQAIGFLQTPYWQIDPAGDLQRFWAHLEQRGTSPASLGLYHKGLAKFGEFLCLREGKKINPKEINWDYFMNGLPDWLSEQVREFVQHCLHRLLPERRVECSSDWLCRVTACLRYFHAQEPLTSLDQITPERWFEYLDLRLLAGRKADTVNSELKTLISFLHFQEENGQKICPRVFLVDALPDRKRLPRDVPAGQLRALYNEIQLEACATHAGLQRMGRMDAAWFLLMLFSGLRTGEIRRLKQGDIDWERKQVRIEQSKGLKDRIVFLSSITINALQSYLALRGPAGALPEQIFIHRHRAVTRSYCFERLQTYARRCGVLVKPHQLRHSCATLLLNSGAPVTTVQAILGHKYIDTTLGYARLYDGTLAADYYRAMNEVERQVALAEMAPDTPPSYGELVALVDSLRRGTLNEEQSATAQFIREGILSLARREENSMKDVKVQVGPG